MKLTALLERKNEEIIDEASQMLSRAHLKHYAASNEEQNKERIAKLFKLTLESVKKHDLIPIMDFAKTLAHERYKGGFDIQEVQTAFNVLEEVIWKKITSDFSPTDYPEAFGLASTVLGAGKQSLAIEYVSLASQKNEMESLDLSRLFRGI